MEPRPLMNATRASLVVPRSRYAVSVPSGSTPVGGDIATTSPELIWVGPETGVPLTDSCPVETVIEEPEYGSVTNEGSAKLDDCVASASWNLYFPTRPSPSGSVQLLMSVAAKVTPRSEEHTSEL